MYWLSRRTDDWKKLSKNVGHYNLNIAMEIVAGIAKDNCKEKYARVDWGKMEGQLHEIK